MRQVVVPGLGLLCILTAFTHADVIELQDGSIIKGKIAGMDSSTMHVTTDYGLLNISIANIKSAKTDSAVSTLNHPKASSASIEPVVPVAVSSSAIFVSSAAPIVSLSTTSAPVAQIPDNAVLLTIRSREKWGRVEKRYFLKGEEIATRVFSVQGEKMNERGTPDCNYERNKECLLFGEGDNTYYVAGGAVVADFRSANSSKMKTPSEADERFHFFLESAYFAGDERLELINKNLAVVRSAAISRGYASATSNSSAGTGWGIRTGISKGVSKSFDWGLAVDYIREPKYSYSLTAYSPAGNGYLSGNFEGQIWRITTFLKGKAYFEEKTALVFGLGLGWNTIKCEEEDNYSGTFVSVLGVSPHYSISESASGGTWDASVGISRLFENGGELEFGIRWVRFYYKNSSTLFSAGENSGSIWDNEYLWKPTSVYLGYKF